MPIIAIALVVAAALGGGVSVAANQSLPGDALWGFKTTVNENIRGAFAQSDETKANWDISLVASRLGEAQKLAAEGKLDAQAQAAITANFDARAQDVAERIANLQEQGHADTAAAVAARFQATIAQHAALIAQINASQSAEAQQTVAPFLADVRGTLDAAANLSASASSNAQLRGANSAGNAGASGTINAGGNANLDNGALKATTSADGSIDISL